MHIFIVVVGYNRCFNPPTPSNNTPNNSPQASPLTPHIRGKSVLGIPYRAPRRSMDNEKEKSSKINNEKCREKQEDKSTKNSDEINFGEKPSSVESQELEHLFSDLMDELNV